MSSKNEFSNTLIDFDDDETQIPDFDDSVGDEEDEENEENGMDMSDMLAQFFTEPKKQRNVAEVLCDIKKQMEIQNKILAQIYTTLSSKV